jgi:hypothetical protein
MTITELIGVLLMTSLQFAIGIGSAYAGYYLLGYVQDVWSKRRAR